MKWKLDEKVIRLGGGFLFLFKDGFDFDVAGAPFAIAFGANVRMHGELHMNEAAFVGVHNRERYFVFSHDGFASGGAG